MKKNLNKKLWAWVRECGSQSEAARRLGVDPAFMHRMLRGTSSPALHTAVKLQKLTRSLPGGSIKPADWVD